MNNYRSTSFHLKFTGLSALLLSVLTLVTFGFAMTAVPPSGPYCPENCMGYPFPDILSYYPRDYYWMYLAIFQLFAFVIFMSANHYSVAEEKRLFSAVGMAFSLISATVLLIAYYTQFSVVPASIMHGETEGIALITQYNERGVFIAMEELGYITMSIALLFLSLTFSSKPALSSVIRVMLILAFPLTAGAFIFYSVKSGIHRSYMFEVAAITINWLLLIPAGFLIFIYFRRQEKALRPYSRSRV